MLRPRRDAATPRPNTEQVPPRASCRAGAAPPTPTPPPKPHWFLFPLLFHTSIFISVFFYPSTLVAITTALPCSPPGPFTSFPFSHPSLPFPSLCSWRPPRIPSSRPIPVLPAGVWHWGRTGPTGGDSPPSLRASAELSPIWGALGDSAGGPISLCSSAHRPSPLEWCPWEH